MRHTCSCWYHFVSQYSAVNVYVPGILLESYSARIATSWQTTPGPRTHTGVGLSNCGLFCQDQLQPAESLVERGGASGLQDGVTLYTTVKTDSKKSNLVELDGLPKWLCHRHGCMKRTLRSMACTHEHHDSTAHEQPAGITLAYVERIMMRWQVLLYGCGGAADGSATSSVSAHACDDACCIDAMPFHTYQSMRTARHHRRRRTRTLRRPFSPS